MSRVLFSSTGSVLLRGGTPKVQVIPSGSTADDCVCCDTGPTCSLCSGTPGGPFNRMDYAATISGFPSGTIKYQDFAGTTIRTRVYNISGLSVINGTYNFSTTAECAEGTTVVDYSNSSTVELWEHPGIFYPNSNCAQTTLLSTHTYTTLRVSVFGDRFNAVLLPAPPIGFNLAYSTSGSLSGVVCNSSSSSNNVAYKVPTSPQQSFSVCSGYSNFTYNYSCTVTGVV